MKNLLANEPKLGSIKYLDGHPRNYRFKAKEGAIEVDGQRIASGKVLMDFQPFVWRVFETELFGKRRQRWMELYGINNSGQVFCINANEYSVRSWDSLYQKAFYDEIVLSQSSIRVTAEERTLFLKKTQQNVSFYVLSFDFSPKGEGAKLFDATKVAEDTAPVYTLDTIKPDEAILSQENYSIPERVAAAVEAMAAAKFDDTEE